MEPTKMPMAADEPAAVEGLMASETTEHKVPRVQMPDRTRPEPRPPNIDLLVGPEHRVRLVWAYVEQLDLRGWYAQIKAVEGHPGRSPIAPEILLALWLYATIEAVGSARALERLCEEHNAYRWLCGGVSVNYHTLANFRSQSGPVLDELLTTSVASLLDVDAVKLTRVAQDGMRVRASAGSKSFRSRDRLEGFLEQAQLQVQQLKDEVENDPMASSRREQAARERATRERKLKIEAAIRRLPEMERAKERQAARGKKKVNQARSSTTDADATIMKMPNGGYNPAYNAQLCTETTSQVIVGVDMISSGVDHGQASAMLGQLQYRYGRTPSEYLVDGGYVSAPEIDAVAATSVIYAPVPAPGNDKLGASEVHEQDSKAVAEWRQRMQTEQAKTIYKERASTAECVNALARERGLTRLRVRGLMKTKSVLLLFALAHNCLRIVALVPAMLNISPSTS